MRLLRIHLSRCLRHVFGWNFRLSPWSLVEDLGIDLHVYYLGGLQSSIDWCSQQLLHLPTLQKLFRCCDGLWRKEWRRRFEWINFAPSFISASLKLPLHFFIYLSNSWFLSTLFSIESEWLQCVIVVSILIVRLGPRLFTLCRCSPEWWLIYNRIVHVLNVYNYIEMLKLNKVTNKINIINI